MKLAPIIESIMLHLDDYVYVLRDAGKDTSIIETVTRRCEQLTDTWQRRQHDCPFCMGIVGVRTSKGRVTEHDSTCILQEDT